MRTPTLVLTLAALLGVACRTNSPSRADAAPPSMATAPTPPSSSSVVSTAQDSAPTWPAHLPKLKPVIKKPFPDGADEITVCEAIDSKEPDLWARFGHLVPMFIPGAIYVLESGPERKDELYDFILRKYVHGYASQHASCRGSLTLMYVSKMYESSEYRGKPFGRQHLSRELEERLGIKTRESYGWSSQNNRLSDYCRADAEACDALLKLNPSNEGRGICTSAVSRCALEGSTTTKEDLLATCKRLPPRDFVCLEFNGTSPREDDECRRGVTAKLCP
jgi:hypothetical protein